MYVFTNTSSEARCDTRSILKPCLTDLDLEFSFFFTGCHTKVKEPCLPNYFLYILIIWRINIEFPRVEILHLSRSRIITDTAITL